MRLEREAGVRVMQGSRVHVDKCEETSMGFRKGVLRMT